MKTTLVSALGTQKDAHGGSGPSRWDTWRPTIGLVQQEELPIDEIGELPLEAQTLLLKTIEEKTYRPLGANADEHSDFQLICGTNTDLATATHLQPSNFNFQPAPSRRVTGCSEKQIGFIRRGVDRLRQANHPFTARIDRALLRAQVLQVVVALPCTHRDRRQRRVVAGLVDFPRTAIGLAETLALEFLCPRQQFLNATLVA